VNTVARRDALRSADETSTLFDTLTWLELQLISNSSSTSNLTLDLEVLDGMVRMTLNVLFQSLDVWVEGERKVFCFYPT
jgi:hypothetical protein